MRAIVRKLKSKLKAGDTTERCGLILRGDKVVEIENIHPEPENGFMVPAKDMVKHESKLIGTWHTHINQSAALSQMDYIGFSQWPELTHFIIGNDGIRAYEVEDGFVREVDLAAN